MELTKQESLGQYLKKTREDKNISIEQVAYATRISLKMLRALEEDAHEILPAPTFVRGYLQAYSKSVRLDTQDLLLRYQHHLATAPGQQKSSLKSHYLYVKERYQEKKRMLLVSSLLVLLVFSGGAYLMLKSKRDRNKQLALQAQQLQSSVVSSTKEEEKHDTVASNKDKLEKELLSGNKKAAVAKIANTETESTKVAPPVASTETPAPATTKPASPTETANKDKAEKASGPSNDLNGPAKQFNLLLTTEQDVWMRYQLDDNAVKEYMLFTNKKVTLHANKVIKIFSGNLGALHGTLNGKELATLMAPNRPKSLILPESEVPNYPLPLFPPSVKKEQPAESTDAADDQSDDQTSSDN